MLRIVVLAHVCVFEVLSCLCVVPCTYLCVCVAGIKYSSCVTKMRQLTLSSMAENNEVIPLASLRDELQLTQEELEDFIIDCECVKVGWERGVERKGRCR